MSMHQESTHWGTKGWPKKDPSVIDISALRCAGSSAPPAGAGAACRAGGTPAAPPDRPCPSFPVGGLHPPVKPLIRPFATVGLHPPVKPFLRPFATGEFDSRPNFYRRPKGAADKNGP
eukprot:8918837-Pyramimonas_sp.AAC.1